MNWNDLQFLLAVSSAGTLSAAARELGVNQTTVTRRIKALEVALGSRLFDRHGREYQLTAEGEVAVGKVSLMHEIAQDLAVSAGNSDHSIAGTVRLTSTLGFIDHFIVPRLNSFIDQYPKITLELIGSSQNLSLARRQADISLRLSRPESSTATVRKVGCMPFSVYGAAKFTESNYGDDPHILWATYDRDLAHLPEHRWLENQINAKPQRIFVNDSVTLMALVTQGIAIGILPCYVADQISSLKKLSGGDPVVSRDLWISTHADIRHIVRIRKVIEWLSQEIEKSDLGLWK